MLIKKIEKKSFKLSFLCENTLTGYTLGAGYTLGTHCIMPNSIQPLAPYYPVFTYFAQGGEYPSTLVPGLPTTAPPFASPPTLSHPTDQVTIFT
jgi:hypothetical protein